MIAGAEQGEQSAGGCSHTTGEQDARFGAFHHRKPPLDDLGVRRVAVSRIPQPIGGTDFLNEIDGLDEWLNDRRISLAVRRAAGDGERGETQAAWRSRHAVDR
jgi:hypothetical protein